MKLAAPLLALILLIGAGCVPRPSRENVYVDQAAVAKAFPAPKIPAVPSSAVVPPATSLRVDIPAMPPTTLRSPKGKDETQIRASIEAARLKARRQLQNRLRDVYFEELDRQQEEAIAGLNPSLAAEAEKARRKQLALFKQYAQEKGFRLARLSLLAGFPDPDPQSRNPKPEFPIAKRFRAEADQIRKELVEIDRLYDDAVQRILADLQGTKDEMLTSLKAKFVEARGAAEDKAEQEANAQMARLYRAFGQTLAEARQISLPGQPTKTLQSPPIDPNAHLAKLDPPAVRSDWSEQLHDQLTIWEAVKGYRIVTSQRAGRDGTSEFLEWLRSHLPGP